MDKKSLKNIDVEKLIWKPNKKGESILREIDTVLGSGRFYGILGPNGAGKTSFVRQILKLKEMSGGNITFDGTGIKSINRHDMAEKLAFLPQGINANVDFTVFDVVAMGREPHRKRFTPLGEDDLQCINEAMEFTNCKELKDKSITLLSGGERQRVMIARTIAQDTPWIILDEPVSNLDIKHQTELMNVLERLRKEKNKTIVAILHDLNLAAAFCTHILLMKDGKIYKEGTTEEVLTKENLSYVYEMDFDFLKDKQRDVTYIAPKIKNAFSGTPEINNNNEIDDISINVKKRWDSIAKPIDSLGLLEDIVIRICRIANSDKPYDLSKRALVIMCADHGVVAEGVTQTGSEVTKIVSENFAKGCSTVNYMAKTAGVDVYTIDIGMNTSCYEEKNLVMNSVIDRKISTGTANIYNEAAMTKDNCQKAIDTGMNIVCELKEKGYGIIAIGEMGIGNTTPTSVLASVFLDMEAEKVTGKGAGLSLDGMDKKQHVVQTVKSRIKEKDLIDPVDILAEAGGYEIAGMVGLCLGGVKYQMPIVLDGAIAAVAALCATKINCKVKDYVIASHVSKEITGKLALDRLGIKAPIHADMCLGEGTGAMTVFPLIDMAMNVYANMGSFDDYNIAAYERFEER